MIKFLIKIPYKILFRAISLILRGICIVGLFISAYLIGLRKSKSDKPRLVWGATPLANNIYWSRAMKQSGYDSQTFTNGFYNIIHKREDWDEVVDEKYPNMPGSIRPLLAFWESLFRYDVFFISFDGYFLGDSSLWNKEAYLLKKAKKKVVVLPYGGDSYVYRRIRSTTLQHGLLMSYPEAARDQLGKAERVDYWCKNADVVIPGLMGPDGFGRWDVLTPTSLSIDTDQWKTSKRKNLSDGTEKCVYIAHAPNHRGFKGTEFVINVIGQLKEVGLNVELILLEKLQNSEVREVLEKKVDILIEQLIFPGHGLNGLEGMASGIPVISNLEDDDYLLPLRRWSFFSECPIVSASPESLFDVLKKLIESPYLRQSLGDAGRQYVEKYHSLEAAQYLFQQVIDYMYGRRGPLINLYHPILGEYKNGISKIKHPLVNNKIVKTSLSTV